MSAQLIFSPHEQGSANWHLDRLAVLTGSRSHAIMPDKRTGKPKTAARKTLLSELVSEAWSGYAEEVNAKALEWGKANEDSAIAALEFHLGKTIEKTGLVYGDETKRYGCSPDGLIKGEKGGVESKSPLTVKAHTDFVLYGEIKDEYLSQCNFGIWALKYDYWIFNSYHPRTKTKMSHYARIYRDPELMEFLDNEVPLFIKEMDQALEKLGMKWGDHRL